MTNQEILEKAIQKAIEGGYNMGGLLSPMDPGSYEVLAPFDGSYLRIEMTNWTGDKYTESINSVIYDRDFAKALWGESEPIKGQEPWQTLGWEHHLKNMVVADDPIEYLGKNI